MPKFRPLRYGVRKLYRRSRKATRGYLGTRRSFLSIGSRLRADPPWKRRKYDALSSQNDDDPSVLGDKAPQSGIGKNTPLSVLRFKSPGSSVFNYHHLVRKVRLGDLSCAAGPAGTLNWTEYKVQFSDVQDNTQIRDLYGQFRMTRFVFEFLPLISSTNWVPIIYSKTYRHGVDKIDNESRALTDPETVIQTGQSSNGGGLNGFAISMTPSVLDIDVEADNSGNLQAYRPHLSPWFLCTTDAANTDHYGCQILVVNNTTIGAGDVKTLYNVFCTVYIDVKDTNEQT